MKYEKLFRTITISYGVFLIAFGTAPLFARQVMSAKQAKQMQAQQRQAEIMQNQAERQKKTLENNTRTFVLLLNDDDLQRKLKVSKKQKEKIDDLDEKFKEIREKTINPEGVKFAGPEQHREAVQKKRDELNELSLKCGKAVMEILTRDQINEYGRHVTLDRAKKQWERKMGIEPEKPEKDSPR